MKKPELKICGVNDGAFAHEAERQGADYLGFIFAEGSPRRVSVEQAKSIAAGLTGASRRVGVFTRAPVEEIVRVVEACGFRIVQLHWRCSAEEVAAFRTRRLEVWTLAGGAEGDGVIFDSTHGDGETAFRRGAGKAILAGGISAENVADAVRLAPDVVDVSGSLEYARGVKSIPRLREFFAAWHGDLV